MSKKTISIDGVFYHGTITNKRKFISSLSTEFSHDGAIWFTDEEYIAKEFAAEKLYNRSKDFYRIVLQVRVKANKIIDLRSDEAVDKLLNISNHLSIFYCIPFLKEKRFNGWLTKSTMGVHTYNDYCVFDNKFITIEKVNICLNEEAEEWTGYMSIEEAKKKYFSMNLSEKILDEALLSEFTNDDLKPLTSFKLHKNLNPKVWDGNKLKPKIRKTLLDIASDYVRSLDLGVVPENVILTGSLANFNYSDYSDFDLHILLDFSKINKDVVLVKKFLDDDRKLWNDAHDIEIEGYNVEIYSQDIDETHTSTGMYSILNDEWIKKPTVKDFKIDIELIKTKAEDLMEDIDDLEKHPDIDKVNKMFKRISKIRKDSIAKDGELGIGNLTFKMLRRNGYLEKLDKLRNKSYDMKYEKLAEKILKEMEEEITEKLEPQDQIHNQEWLARDNFNYDYDKGTIDYALNHDPNIYVWAAGGRYNTIWLDGDGSGNGDLNRLFYRKN